MIDEVQLADMVWKRGEKGRIWTLQPRLAFDDTAPFIPKILRGEPTGFDLIKATLDYENKCFDPPEAAPALILLPELGLLPADVQKLQAYAASNLRKNSLLVAGLGHLTERQARMIEDKDLWDGPAERKFTNSALILTGGSSVAYLQPKIIPSQWELNYHWRGKTVHYFQASYFSFVVVICSELLNRPENRTTIGSVVDYMQRNNRTLNLVIWLQCNPKPRSPEFDQSIDQLGTLKPTILVASSRSERPGRIDNFSVSGGIVPHTALASTFSVLNKRFHYIEPLKEYAEASRAVLLRYDAHTYRVDTVLADCIAPSGKTEKSAFFEQSQPYLVQSSGLLESHEHIHLADISNPAVSVACETPFRDFVSVVADRLTSLETEDFLGFFDIAFLPKPVDETERHVAGQRHGREDFQCRCWRHRETIDNLSVEPEQRFFAELLVAMAAMEDQSLNVKPDVDRTLRTNLRLTIKGKDVALGLVHPCDNNANGTQKGLWGKNNARIVSSLYIVLGVGDRPVSIMEIDAARVRPYGAINPGNAEPPVLKAIYSKQFRDGITSRTIAELIGEYEAIGAT